MNDKHNGFTRILHAQSRAAIRLAAQKRGAERAGPPIPADVRRYLERETWVWDTIMAPPAEPDAEQRILLRWWQGDMPDRGRLLCDVMAGIEWRARRAQLAPAHAAAWWAFVHRRAAHADRKRNPAD